MSPLPGYRERLRIDENSLSTASRRSYCNTQQKGRENVEGLERCGHTTSKTGHSWTFIDELIGPNDQGWWLKHISVHPNSCVSQGMGDDNGWNGIWWMCSRREKQIVQLKRHEKCAYCIVIDLHTMSIQRQDFCTCIRQFGSCDCIFCSIVPDWLFGWSG